MLERSKIPFCQDSPVKATSGSCVASSAAKLFDFQDKGVLIAINQDLVDDLVLARCGSFVPDLLP